MPVTVHTWRVTIFMEVRRALGGWPSCIVPINDEPALWVVELLNDI
jgi:hypothetical protein